MEKSRNLAGEFLLILASVMVALGAQAWWQNREEHAREADYLRALAVDGRVNARLLRSAMSEESTYVARTSALFHIIRSNADVSADSAAPLIRVSYSDFDPVTGTLESVISSGDLRLFRSDSVRYALGQLSADFRGVAAVLAQTQQVAWTVPLAQVMNRHWPRGHADADVKAILNDPELATTALETIGMNRTRLNALVQLDSSNSHMLSVVEAQIQHKK